jgi:hypothetical protein
VWGLYLPPSRQGRGGINYQPHAGKFATSLHRINFLMWNQELEKLSAMVSDPVRDYGVKSVGVILLS